MVVVQFLFSSESALLNSSVFNFPTAIEGFQKLSVKVYSLPGSQSLTLTFIDPQVKAVHTNNKCDTAGYSTIWLKWRWTEGISFVTLKVSLQNKNLSRIPIHRQFCHLFFHYLIYKVRLIQRPMSQNSVLLECATWYRPISKILSSLLLGIGTEKMILLIFKFSLITWYAAELFRGI